MDNPSPLRSHHQRNDLVLRKYRGIQMKNTIKNCQVMRGFEKGGAEVPLKQENRFQT